MKNPDRFTLRRRVLVAMLLVFSCGAVAQQSNPSPPVDSAVRELDSQVQELRALIEQMRSENEVSYPPPQRVDGRRIKNRNLCHEATPGSCADS